MPVAVVVHKSAPGPPRLAGTAHSCLVADVAKRAVPVVVVQHILAVVADVQIGVAVVVVVADAHALSPPGMHEPCLLRDIGEGAVVIISIEMIAGRSLAGRRPLKLGAIDDKDVRPAVVVEIKDRHASPGSLNDVLLGGDAAKDIVHGKPTFRSNVGEPGDGLAAARGSGGNAAGLRDRSLRMLAGRGRKQGQGTSEKERQQAGEKSGQPDFGGKHDVIRW